MLLVPQPLKLVPLPVLLPDSTQSTKLVLTVLPEPALVPTLLTPPDV